MEVKLSGTAMYVRMGYISAACCFLLFCFFILVSHLIMACVIGNQQLPAAHLFDELLACCAAVLLLLWCYVFVVNRIGGAASMLTACSPGWPLLSYPSDPLGEAKR